jgi:hypothetical protein
MKTFLREKYNFLIRVGILILSFITPFIMLISYGKLQSISSYWDTFLQPLFIISNALTTYVFVTLPKWRLSAIFLFLLTIFSVEYYPSLHNIFAVSFFIINIYPLYTIKRYRVLILPYTLSIVWLPNIFWVEVHAITILCVYHFILMVKLYKISLKRLL